MCVAGDTRRAEEGCEGAAVLLGGCVVTMLLTNALQAYVVKLGSAALSVLIVTLVTPVSAIAFTLPFVMGSHAESPGSTTWIALALLLFGVMVFRVPTLIDPAEPPLPPTRLARSKGGQGGQEEGKEEQRGSFLALGGDSVSRSRADSESQAPVFMASRLGIIASEYSNGGGDPRGILFECTHAPIAASYDAVGAAPFSPAFRDELSTPLSRETQQAQSV